MMFLAIDYGKKRLGLATGSVIPRGAGVLSGTLPRPALFKQIKQICDDLEVERIVVGLPIRSQGEEGTLAPEIREFGRGVSEFTGRPVDYEPEQFTSTEAKDQLLKAGKKIAPGDIDELAAILILEQYLGGRDDQT